MDKEKNKGGKEAKETRQKKFAPQIEHPMLKKIVLCPKKKNLSVNARVELKGNTQKGIKIGLICI